MNAYPHLDPAIRDLPPTYSVTVTLIDDSNDSRDSIPASLMATT